MTNVCPTERWHASCDVQIRLQSAHELLPKITGLVMVEQEYIQVLLPACV